MAAVGGVVAAPIAVGGSLIASTMSSTVANTAVQLSASAVGSAG